MSGMLCSNSFCRARKVILNPVFLLQVELVFGTVSYSGNSPTQCWCSLLQKIPILRKTKEDMKLQMGLNKMQSLKHSMLSIYKPKASSIKSLSRGYLIAIIVLLLNLYHRIRAGRYLRRPSCLSLAWRHTSHTPNILISPNRCLSNLFF